MTREFQDLLIQPFHGHESFFPRHSWATKCMYLFLFSWKIHGLNKAMNSKYLVLQDAWATKRFSWDFKEKSRHLHKTVVHSIVRPKKSLSSLKWIKKRSMAHNVTLEVQENPKQNPCQYLFTQKCLNYHKLKYLTNRTIFTPSQVTLYELPCY